MILIRLAIELLLFIIIIIDGRIYSPFCCCAQKFASNAINSMTQQNPTKLNIFIYLFENCLKGCKLVIFHEKLVTIVQQW